ncbi:unnamed protein product [Chironomus riparius]|uniref:Sister chromatid cohesion protein DCC1 n=1 Tax=Chironomus riparius TaxID=315576 RepID=A0A9N9WPY2_9DIPT|nr:unnamed protein product [Chironomus riparius]
MEVDHYVRNSEDLKEVIAHAKLDAKNLTKITQAIYFNNYHDLLGNDETSDIKLLELDHDLLKEVEAGSILTFRGGLNDKVCLCSRNKTYEIRNAEQTNSMIVIPDLLNAERTSDSPLKSPEKGSINKSLDRSLEDDEVENTQEALNIPHEIQHKHILKVFYNYLEPRQIQPQIKKIYELLKLTCYNGPENEDSINKKHLFTKRQLFTASQCSAAEFDAQLEKLRSIKINEYIRILDYAYEFRVITLMTNMINENSWKLNEVDKTETISALEDIVPVEILQAVFNYYTIRDDETGKYEYKEDMVCRIIALNVLQEGLKFHIDEFLDVCQGGLPEGMKMDESYLHGIGVIDRESQIPSIKGLFEGNLPLNLQNRLTCLFKAKEKWTVQQITPYLELFTTPKMQVSTLLTKYTRSVSENGIRYYQAKHK